MPELGGQLARFALLGGANTLVTAALLALLATFLDARLAYSLVFVLGLAFTTALTGRVVFRTTPSKKRIAVFVGWYLLVYVVGLIVVRVLDHDLGWGPAALALGTVAVTAPLSFVGGRWILHTSATRAATGAST